MLTLQEISELGAAAAERTIAMSKAIDYAWLKDDIAGSRGEQTHYLHDIIDRQYADALRELNGNGIPNS